MAYVHSRYEVRMTPNYRATGITDAAVTGGVDLVATGIKARWAPGIVPHIIRGAAIVQTATTFGSAAGAFRFEADLTTPGTPTHLFSIVVPTIGSIHTSMYYKATYIIEIKPGQIVDFRVTAAGVGGAEVILYVEPRWEEPANITGMVKTA